MKITLEQLVKMLTNITYFTFPNNYKYLISDNTYKLCKNNKKRLFCRLNFMIAIDFDTNFLQKKLLRKITLLKQQGICAI